MYQNYITGQTALTLNLDFSIPNNHLATVISAGLSIQFQKMFYWEILPKLDVQPIIRP